MTSIKTITTEISKLNSQIAELNAGVRDSVYARKVSVLFERRNQLVQQKIMIAAGRRV
jgi:hypothetical protein